MPLHTSDKHVVNYVEMIYDCIARLIDLTASDPMICSWLYVDIIYDKII